MYGGYFDTKELAEEYREKHKLYAMIPFLSETKKKWCLIFDLKVKEKSIFQSDIVKNANIELKTINSNLNVKSVGNSKDKTGNITIHISTSFPLRGNKDIITALEKLGWKKTIRYKRRTDGNRTRNQYAGYEMYQEMSKYFI